LFPEWTPWRAVMENRMSQTPDVERELKALTRQRIRLIWEKS